MALPFSDSDKAKYMTGQYVKEIRMDIPQLGLSILNDEIYAESLSLEEAIFDGNGELSICGCISNRFSIEIRNQGVQLKNKTIYVFIRIDNGAWNRIFTGYVESVETVRDRSYQKLQCYDALYKNQDKNFFWRYNTLANTFTVKNLRDAFFNYIGVTQEDTTLVNDAIVLSKTIEDREIACIDVIRAICQMNGVFGKIGADGVFRYVSIKIPSDFLPYPSDEIFPGSDVYPSDATQETIYVDKYRSVSYEDYEVARITGVTVRDGSSDVDYGQAGSSDNALLIEGNMFCNGLRQELKETIAENIFSKVETYIYTPFEATSTGLPYVECGDAVTYYVYDYSGDEPETDIMGFSVLSRYLKGIQWMTDTYIARGDEYQPEVIPADRSGGSSKDVEQVKKDVSDIKQSVEDLDEALNNKQDFIDVDILAPAGTANEGHIQLGEVSTPTGNFYRWYRMESGHWQRMNFARAGDEDLTPGVSDLPTGELYFVYE